MEENEMEEYITKPSNSALLPSQFWESVLERQQEILKVRKGFKVDIETGLFGTFDLVANLTKEQERHVCTISNFIGDLADLGLETAIPPFRHRIDTIENVSRSREGFQQKQFNSQSVDQNIKQSMEMQKNKRRTWRQ